VTTGRDADFCRNVMIYFEEPPQARVLHRLARLAPDGLLFAGHAENFTHARELFEPQGRSVHRLAAGGTLSVANARNDSVPRWTRSGVRGDASSCCRPGR
jgi:hypothetical protein